MRVLDGDQVLVRVFIGESDRWKQQPLETALVERLRAGRSRQALAQPTSESLADQRAQRREAATSRAAAVGDGGFQGGSSRDPR
jgi:uncharacterized protein DUF190